MPKVSRAGKKQYCVDCDRPAEYMVQINKKYNITYPLCGPCKDRREGKKNV